MLPESLPHVQSAVALLSPADLERFLSEFHAWSDGLGGAAMAGPALAMVVAKAQAHDPLVMAWEAVVLDLDLRVRFEELVGGLEW